MILIGFLISVFFSMILFDYVKVSPHNCLGPTWFEKFPEADEELMILISDHHILGTICFLHQNPPMAIILTTQLQHHFQW